MLQLYGKIMELTISEMLSLIPNAECIREGEKSLNNFTLLHFMSK